MYRRNRLLVGGTGLVLMAVIYSIARAACVGCVPIGTQIDCMTTCNAMRSPFTGVSVPFTTTGVGSFRVVAANASLRRSELQPTHWTGTGTSDELGEVTWQFEASRTVQNSIIQSIGPNDFPATGDLYFHVTGTMDAFPGIVYRSVTPLHLHSDNLTSFAPFHNEDFTLVEPVVFEEATVNPDGGGDSFTLSDLTLHIE